MNLFWFDVVLGFGFDGVSLFSNDLKNVYKLDLRVISFLVLFV